MSENTPTSIAMKAVASTIARIQRSPEAPSSKRDLAALKRQVGRPLDEAPISVLLLVSVGDEIESNDLRNTVETAIHSTLTMWAKNGIDSHVPGVSVGALTAKFYDPAQGEVDAGARRRYDQAISNADAPLEMTATRVRRLIQLAQSKGHGGLDYAKLAADLIALQNPDRAQDVRRRWALDLNRGTHSSRNRHAAETSTTSTIN